MTTEADSAITDAPKKPRKVHTLSERLARMNPQTFAEADKAQQDEAAALKAEIDAKAAAFSAERKRRAVLYSVTSS